MKFITPSAHVIIDYMMVLFLAAAPSLFNLPMLPSTILYVLAAAYGLVTLLTNAPTAPIHLIPFKVHGGLELLGGILTLAAPWLFGFDHFETSRNLFLAVGAVTLIVFLCTIWREEPRHNRAHA